MKNPTLYRTTKIDGLSIFYREAGPKDAPTLLLLHGHLRTAARRTRFGTLKVQREIPEVIDTEHVKRRQQNLFEDEEPQ